MKKLYQIGCVRILIIASVLLPLANLTGIHAPKSIGNPNAKIAIKPVISSTASGTASGKSTSSASSVSSSSASTSKNNTTNTTIPITLPEPIIIPSAPETVAVSLPSSIVIPEKVTLSSLGSPIIISSTEESQAPITSSTNSNISVSSQPSSTTSSSSSANTNQGISQIKVTGITSSDQPINTTINLPNQGSSSTTQTAGWGTLLQI